MRLWFGLEVASESTPHALGLHWLLMHLVRGWQTVSEIPVHDALMYEPELHALQTRQSVLAEQEQAENMNSVERQLAVQGAQALLLQAVLRNLPVVQSVQGVTMASAVAWHSETKHCLAPMVVQGRHTG